MARVNGLCLSLVTTYQVRAVVAGTTASLCCGHLGGHPLSQVPSHFNLTGHRLLRHRRGGCSICPW